MPNETDTLIQQEFDKLPLETKEALSRVDWRTKVREIAKEENLDADKTLSLETETMFILFGILSPEHYLQNIISEVSLEEDTAKRIEKKVTEQVFNEVEKQYEMITALMPKAEEVPLPKGYSVAITKPVADTPVPTSTPQPTQAIEIPQNKIIEAPDNLPVVASEATPIVVETPAAQAVVPETAAPLPPMPLAPISRPSNLNLIDTARPTSDAKPDSVPTKASDYQPGKDPYREPTE